MSRILKGGGDPAAPPPARERVVPAAELEARRSAADLLADARAEAERIRAGAEEAAEAARQQGYDRGYQEGLARTTECLARAHAQRDELLAAAEPAAVELALRVAEKVLGREISDREAAVDLVAQALDAVRRAQRVRVRVAPADLELLRAEEPRLVARLAQGVTFDLCADPGTTTGGCIVETEAGSVDARLETQLAALRRALLGDD